MDCSSIAAAKSPKGTSRMAPCIGRPTGKLEFSMAGRPYLYDYASILPRLGQAPDEELAAAIGCTRTNIFRLRRRLGIPPWDRMARVRPYLGKLPDAVLARHFSVSAATICRERRSLGIAVCDQRRLHADALLREYVRRLQEV